MVGGIQGISEYLNQVVTAFGTPRQGPIDTTNPEAVKQRNPGYAPTPKAEPPKPVASKVVQPGQGGGDQFDPMAAYMQQQAAAAEQARRDAMGANLARAGAAIGSVMTRSPSARAALSGMVGGVSTGGGGGGGGAGGGLSFDAFSNYAKLLEGRKRRPQLIKSLAERTGKDPSYYEGMDDATLNNLGQLAMTPKIEKITLANGDIVTIDTSDPKAMAQLRLTDPDAAQKLADDRVKTQLEIAKTGVTVEAEKRQQEAQTRTVAQEASQLDAAKKFVTANPEIGVTPEAFDAMKPDDRSGLIKILNDPLTTVAQKREEIAAFNAATSRAAETRLGKESEAKLKKDKELEEQLPIIDSRYGWAPGTAAQHFNAGSLDTVMAENDKNTPDYKAWQELRKQEILEGTKPTPYSEFMWTTGFAKAPTGGPGGETFKATVLPDLKERAKAVEGAIAPLTHLTERLGALKRGEVAVGPIGGSETFRKSMGLMKTLFPEMDISGVTEGQKLDAGTQAAIAAGLKKYGITPTDKDAALALKELGESTLTEEALFKITRMVIKRNVTEVLKLNEHVSKLQKIPGFARDPAYSGVLETFKRDLPDYSTEMFSSKELSSFQNDYLNAPVDEKQKAILLKDFDKKHGQGMANYLLSVHPEWMK